MTTPTPPRTPTVAGRPASDRLMGSLDYRLRPDARRLTRSEVATVLHGLADHTALQAALAWQPGDPATSVGRWLHAVGDDLERGRRMSTPTQETGETVPLPEQLVRIAADIAAATALSPGEALDNLRAAAGYLTRHEADARAARAVEQERARVVALVREHSATSDHDHALLCEGCDWAESPGVRHEDHLADLIEV